MAFILKFLRNLLIVGIVTGFVGSVSGLVGMVGFVSGSVGSGSGFVVIVGFKRVISNGEISNLF